MSRNYCASHGYTYCTCDEPSETSKAEENTKPTNPKDALGIAKAPLHCISARVMMELGLAMMEGGRKYGTHNYRAMGVRASVYYDATMRHMMAYWEGEDIDPDSGVSHVTKAIATLVVLRDSMLMENFEDDRPIRLPKGLNLSDLNEQAAEIIKKYPECKMPFIHAGPKLKEEPTPVYHCDACKEAAEEGKKQTERLRKHDAIERHQQAKPDTSRAGEAWSILEEDQLRDEVRHLFLPAIAAIHKRTTIAIESRMEKLNLEFKPEVEHEEGKVARADMRANHYYNDNELCQCDFCRT